jgi:hypothetical protein
MVIRVPILSASAGCQCDSPIIAAANPTNVDAQMLTISGRRYRLLCLPDLNLDANFRNVSNAAFTPRRSVSSPAIDGYTGGYAKQHGLQKAPISHEDGRRHRFRPCARRPSQISTFSKCRYRWRRLQDLNLLARLVCNICRRCPSQQTVRPMSFRSAGAIASPRIRLSCSSPRAAMWSEIPSRAARPGTAPVSHQKRPRYGPTNEAETKKMQQNQRTGL